MARHEIIYTDGLGVKIVGEMLTSCYVRPVQGHHLRLLIVFVPSSLIPGLLALPSPDGVVDAGLDARRKAVTATVHVLDCIEEVS